MNWNAVVADLGPKLLRYFLAVFSRETASDLVQETLIRLLRKVEDGAFDPARGSLRMLAFGIARNVRREAGKHSRRVTLALFSEADLVAEAPDSDERVPRLRAAIARLQGDEREVVLLYLDEELTLAEIGLLLAMPIGTVKSHLHRAKARLREILEVNDG